MYFNPEHNALLAKFKTLWTKRTEKSISQLLWFWLLYISSPCFLVAQSREYSAETSPRGSHRGLGAIQREGEKTRRRAFSSGWFDCDVLPVWLSACGVSFIFPQLCPLTPTTTAALPEHNTPTKPCVPPVCSSMTPSPCGLTAAFSSLSLSSLSPSPSLSLFSLRENHPGPQACRKGDVLCSTVNPPQLPYSHKLHASFSLWTRLKQDREKTSSRILLPDKGAASA